MRIIRLVEALPKSMAPQNMAQQLPRCGTSVGANYRAAARARSRADFVAKMGIVEEECDVCLYWLDLLIECGTAKQSQVGDLTQESNEILSMVVAPINTARSRT